MLYHTISSYHIIIYQIMYRIISYIISHHMLYHTISSYHIICVLEVSSFAIYDQYQLASVLFIVRREDLPSLTLLCNTS